MKHRVYDCMALESDRLQFISPELRARARAAPDGHPLYCRGILPKSLLPKCAPPDLDLNEHWIRGEHGALFEGSVYLDGSLRNSSFGDLRTGGWAAVQLGGHGPPRATGRGVIPIRTGDHDGSLRAMRDHGFDMPVERLAASAESSSPPPSAMCTPLWPLHGGRNPRRSTCRST
jgi:hypothetical protein